ncbi:DUF167 domain-containing protein [Hymenobacter bucti]|uniref:UPF0235 protein ACFSDX_04775 n=1 Tax=Hymenobacter bucti TaxID=1844114 RepID=A0ABW4QQA0_9BACT
MSNEQVKAKIAHCSFSSNARHNELLPGPDGRWTVRLAAPPQGGKANATLLAFIAEVFGVAKSSVQLLSGHTAPFKNLKISDLSEEEGAAALARYQA